MTTPAEDRILDVLSSLESQLKGLGEFERVNFHEPKNAPGRGITAAVWLQRISPVPRESGLNKTTARVEFNVRLYMPMTQEPQDAIDPEMTRVTIALMRVYSGGFTLGGRINSVDLLGRTGSALSSQAGYITVGGTMYRAQTIVLPLIINDVWEQVG